MHKILKNKTIYLSPFNDLSQKLFHKLSEMGVDIVGFVDSYKTGNGIVQPTEIKDYDYVVISSPEYWTDISLNFDNEKILLTHSQLQPLISYSDYMNYLDNCRKKYDILFLVYNKSNVQDASIVIRELNLNGYSAAIIETSNQDRDNLREGLLENKDIPVVIKEFVPYIDFKTLVCLIDWADRKLIRDSQEKGIKTIGLVDGIEDFEDADYAYDRQAYKTVEYVLVSGRNDMRHLEYKKDKCSIVGLPKMHNLWTSLVQYPTENLVAINLNFTYGSFEDMREMWLGQVIEVCESLNINYVICQHHADRGEIPDIKKSKEDVYTTIKKSSLVISRFSTVISEALALGKPVVYHNPHHEKVQLYKNPLGAFSISDDVESLKSMITYEMSNSSTVRERAKDFLDAQFNIREPEKPAVLAAKKIISITEEGKL
ncbi:hypothetical protein KKG77_04120 [bacterium]|nr:hypothetical protein [bacterium]